MAYTIALHVKTADIWALESPYPIVEGSTPTITLEYLGATSVSTPVGTVFRSSTDVTATVMPSGSATASGNIITLKPLTGLVGGRSYVIAVSCAEYPIKKIQLDVQKDEALQ